ncbi:MAG: class I SAM-dependent methyltransferase [Bacteroidetes bacterium]|nr:class I SAM-dependent methyltransferase [Bacteroidota bacterium]
MKNSPWYEQLFENYSKTYDKEVFTQGTLQEVDFIENEINFNTDIRILDVGCGTGRHSVELAKRGYKVTGFDLSKDQLNGARQKAKGANVDVEFLQLDARNFQLDEKFDLAIMLCEGGFPLMDTDEENFAILKNVTSALNSGGKFIFTTLSVLYPIFNNLKKFHDENKVNGSFENHSFDLMTFRDRNLMDIPDDDGNIRKLDCNERYYAPSEITWLLKSLTMKNIEILGCEIGNFKKKKLEINDFEMMVISEK